MIGSGWAFVKHVLSSNEKKVFMVVLPAQVSYLCKKVNNNLFSIQVISNVAYIILEESDLGEIGHNFWKEVTSRLMCENSTKTETLLKRCLF